MKYIYLKILLLALTLTAVAKENTEEYQTILKRDPVGGFGAFDASYTEIDAQQAICFGGRGGVLLDKNFALGVGGRAFLNDYKYVEAINKESSLVGGYGGIFTEIIVAPKWPVHLNIPVLFGLGGISYTTLDKSSSDYVQVNDIENTVSFFIAEPGLELEVNASRFVRIALFGSYRFTSNIIWEKTSPDVLKGFSAGIVLKFGKF